MAMSTVTFRITSEETASLYAAVKQMRLRKKWRTSYTISDFIREAVGEKLDHLERGRQASKKRTAKQSGDDSDESLPPKAKILANEGTWTPISEEGMS